MESPFDPDRATFPTRTVPVAEVVDLLQVTHDPQGVLAYRRAMQNGERFPPISVVRLAGRYVMTDGHKRFSAFLGLAQSQVVVEIWPLRRLAADLWRQFERTVRRMWRVSTGLTRGEPARREARRFLRDTVVHTWRMIISLSRRLTA